MITILDVKNPLLITAVILVFSLGVAFPINILYPFSLEIVEDSKGRSAALIQAGRLILTAISLELVSYYYVGSFFFDWISMFVSLAIGLYFCWRLLHKKSVFVG